ncbi:hypothetical protein ACWC5I_03215 [Kitasatospora sp. NPDC001574]
MRALAWRAHHSARDTTVAEDASEIGGGNTPRTMSTFRNLAGTLARVAGLDQRRPLDLIHPGR